MLRLLFALLNNCFAYEAMITWKITAYKIECHCSINLSIVGLEKDCLSMSTFRTGNFFCPRKCRVEGEILHHWMFSNRWFYKFVSVDTESVCFFLMITVSACKVKGLYGSIFLWVKHVIAFWTEFDGHLQEWVISWRSNEAASWINDSSDWACSLKYFWPHKFRGWIGQACFSCRSFQWDQQRYFDLCRFAFASLYY